MSVNLFSSPKRLAVGILAAGAAFTLAACGPSSDNAADTTTQDPAAVEDPTATGAPVGEDPMAEDPTATEAGTVVDVAAENSDFSTFVEVVEAAGLTETLTSTGPVTVFAPTNAAFEALPEGTLDELLLPENQATLQQILVYHVLQQEVPSAQATAGEVQTAAGAPLEIMVDEATGEIMVNNARVVEPDIQASNGLIHGVDQVILPPDVTL
ncbi:MAG: fasciclin domain-containing protein [Nodosilinea sp.]